MERGSLRKLFERCGFAAFAMALVLSLSVTVWAAQEETIKPGIYIEDIDVGGMSEAEAIAAVEAYVDSLKPTMITLVAANDQTVQTTAGELGLAWSNKEIIGEALSIGQTGSVITRYKVLKDLEHENKIYEMEFSFDFSAINQILVEQCAVYDQKAVNATLRRENGEFIITPGQTGYMLDVEDSIDIVYDYLTQEWDREAASIALHISVEEPVGTAEDLAQVQDVLGTYTTSFRSSNASRSANVTNGCVLIDGTTLYPGEEFSTYEAVAPFSVANGYYMAGSYLNGKVVDSLGGGICQVSTTLYNAVLLSELEVTERHNHSMIVTYVDPSADAAIAESSGKDFRFVNNLDTPIYIEGSIENKTITFTIYGKETRDSNRVVTYVSEILERNDPPADTIYVDAGHPIGYIVKEGAHIGYKARLWKVVTVDGVEVERTQVNSSTYKMVPRSATVGVATDNPEAYNAIMEAIAAASISQVEAVIASLQAPPADPAAVPAENTEALAP